MPPRRRATVEALCRRLVPAAFQGEGPAGEELVAGVAGRMATLPQPLAGRISLALAVFDHPVTGLLLHARPHRFSREPAERQDARLRAWEHSRLAPRRTVFQALRRLVLATWYTQPGGQKAAGYLGPYHARGPVHAWEGPLPGEPRPDEPVARLTPSRDGAAETRDTDRAGASADSVAPTPREHVAPSGVTEGAMLADGRSVRADVCVIGTGAGGGVAAARLAEAGLDVVVLEEGGYWTAADFTEDEGVMTSRLYADGGARATDDLAITLLQGRSVGGGTTVNWMIMLRPAESVMAEWAREHGAEALSASALLPALARVEEEVHARLVPDDAHNPQNRVILDGAAALGWAARPAAINARGCVRAGLCGLGCRYGAKQSTLVTYVPRALAAGARLFSDVRAERIEMRERGGPHPLKRIRATIIDRETGEPRGHVTVDAPVVVLAAGAVGTPAILQRSGLGGPAVGRYLRLHPTTAIEGEYQREIYGAAGIPQSSLLTEFSTGGDGYGFWIECPPLLPGLAAVATPGFGAEHAHRMASFTRTSALIVLVRDGAIRGESAGRVSLDRHGRPRIHYRLQAPERARLAEGMQAAARLHLAAGAEAALTLHTRPVRVRAQRDLREIATRSLAPNRIGLFSAHVNGTCRMGTDHRSSGCSPDAQVWGAPGVYVADGAALPTAPGVNPQATIMAAATVIAERIADRVRR